jgi:hypothetical protein
LAVVALAIALGLLASFLPYSVAGGSGWFSGYFFAGWTVLSGLGALRVLARDYPYDVLRIPALILGVATAARIARAARGRGLPGRFKVLSDSWPVLLLITALAALAAYIEVLIFFAGCADGHQ